jgi:hypothetical protein
MSAVHYPIGLVASQAVERVDRTLMDEFESGATSARRVWGDKFFKRRLSVLHAPLTVDEFRYLRSFYVQRGGRYDSFWFRDNIGREGNINVRFGENMKVVRSDGVYKDVQTELHEIAPARALPELEEVVLAAGSSPFLWWDPNRITYYEHCGVVYQEATIYDAIAQVYPGVWQSGAMSLYGVASAQYQSLLFNGAKWAKTAANGPLVGTQPALTIFLTTNTGAATTHQMIVGIGDTANNAGLGIAKVNSNLFSTTYGTSGPTNETNYIDPGSLGWTYFYRRGFGGGKPAHDVSVRGPGAHVQLPTDASAGESPAQFVRAPALSAAGLTHENSH